MDVFWQNEDRRDHYEVLDSLQQMPEENRLRSIYAAARNLHPKSKDNSVFYGFALGFAFTVGVYTATTSILFPNLGLFITLISVFHLLEWAYVYTFHPADLSSSSFLLNHSPAFNIAMVAAVVEYLIETALRFHFKRWRWLYLSAFFFSLCAQALRTGAMFWAGRSFHHQIREARGDGQRLVRDGVYKYLRHPSYMGWFWWALGTQLVLCNPICFLGYCWQAWKFFQERIEDEEYHLLRIFREYEEYRQETWVGIPFLERRGTAASHRSWEQVPQ